MSIVLLKMNKPYVVLKINHKYFFFYFKFAVITAIEFMIYVLLHCIYYLFINLMVKMLFYFLESLRKSRFRVRLNTKEPIHRYLKIF